MPGSSNISVEHLCDLCHRLHCTLAEADMLSRRCKRRSGILRALFRLIDLKSAQLNLHIAKLCLEVSHLCVCVGVDERFRWGLGEGVTGGAIQGIQGTGEYKYKRLFFFFFFLQLCVSGNNLLNICKLIFQISRTESNDIFFQNNSFIGQGEN